MIVAEENYINYVKRELVRTPKYTKKITIRSSGDAHRAFRDFIQKKDLELEIYDREIFFVMLINRANTIQSIFTVSSGTLTGTVVDRGMIAREAILRRASSVIIAHNHPSGSLIASEADKRVTKDLDAALRVLDIKLFDHLILNPLENDYSAFSDQGLL